MNFGSLLLALTFCCCCCEFALSQRGFGDTGAMYNNVMRRVDDLTYEFQAKLRDLSDEVQAQHSRTSRTVAQLKASVETIMLVMQQLLDEKTKPRNCSDYKFVVTTRKGSFDDVRRSCQNMSGDLFNINNGVAGEKYHAKIRSLIQSSEDYWIGLTKDDQKDAWSLFSGQSFGFSDRHSRNLYNWHWGRPRYMAATKNCANIDGYYKALKDNDCKSIMYGLCEICA